MTTNRALDATLGSWLEGEAEAPIPSGCRARVLASIETRPRRRPDRLASLGSHWITDHATRGRFGVSRPALAVWSALILLLAIALLGTAALVGGQVLDVPIASPVPDSPRPSTDTVRGGPVTTWVPEVIPAVGQLNEGTYSYLNIDDVGINARFTVPEGWSWDGRSLRKDGGGRASSAAIMFYGLPVDVRIHADPCHWKSGRSTVTRNIDRLAAALEAQPSRNPSRPPNPWAPGINIPTDSARGLLIDLTVPAALDLTTCDEGEYRSWTIGERSRSHEGAGQRDRVSVIDTYGMYRNLSDPGFHSGPGGIIIDAASFPGTSPIVMAEMDAIIQSIGLGHWG